MQNIPLHEKIKTSAKQAVLIQEQQSEALADLRSKYQACFCDDKGDAVVDDLIITYITGRSVTGSMTPNEIMFHEGQNSVVMRILSLINKTEGK